MSLGVERKDIIAFETSRDHLLIQYSSRPSIENVYIYIYREREREIYICIYICIIRERERDREREREITCVYIYIYAYKHNTFPESEVGKLP